MDNQQISTAEKPVSKTISEIIKEAKRIEESLLHTSKGHFYAAHFWKYFHLFIGVPMVILSAIKGGSLLEQHDPTHIYSGIASIIVVAFSALMTFFNPNEKSSTHLNAGNHYDALMNKTRIFWSIDCWRDESEQELTEKLKTLSEQKDKLNQSCPQAPYLAYIMAKRGIKKGEGDFTVDKK